MELSIEVTSKRAWLLGRHSVSLWVDGLIPGSSSEVAQTALALFQSLSLPFGETIASHLSPHTAIQADFLSVLAHLARQSGRRGGGTVELPLKLENLRGMQQSQSRDRRANDREELIFIRGIVELPPLESDDGSEDAGESEQQARLENFQIEVSTVFDSFRPKGGIEYRLELREQLPAELQSRGAAFLQSPEYPVEVAEFRISSDVFRSSAPGMSVGLIPAVAQETRLSCGGNRLRLCITKELERGSAPQVVADSPELVAFDRALVSHRLYTGLRDHCIQKLNTA